MKPWETYSSKPWERYKSSSPELELEGNTVKTKTFGIGEDEFIVSTPEQRQQWAAQGPEGCWEYAIKTRGSDIYYGQLMGTGSLTGLVNRLRDDEYKNPEQKEKDEQALYDVMLRKEESMIRGSTRGKNIYRIAANIPSFAMEFALTGGLASTTRQAMKKGIIETAKRGLVKKGLATLGREAVVGLARTTVLPHRVLAAYGQKNLNEHLAITDKGIQILNESAERPAVTFLKAYGDTFVELYSETLGGELFRPIGRVAARGILNRMPQATRSVFTNIANGISKKIPKGKLMNLLSRGGWDGLIEEYGEERAGALLRSVIPGLDERDVSIMDKLQQAVFPGWDQAMIEIGAFAIYGGLGASTQLLMNTMSSKALDNMTEQEKDKMALELGETFEDKKLRAEVVIKAASGEELTAEENQTLNTIHKEFVDKGLIKAAEPITDIWKQAHPKGEGEIGKVDFQERVIAAQDLQDTAKEQKYKIPINGDGSVTIYHGTSIENAQKINTSGKIESQSFFSPNKKGAEFYGKTKNKAGEILPIKVDARDIEYSTGTGEIYAPKGLVRDTDGIWKSPERLFQPKGEGEISESQTKAQEIIEVNAEIPKVTTESIKQDVSGRTILVKQIEVMEDRQMRVTVAQDALSELEEESNLLKRRIEKYKGDYLKEELTGIPPIYITKEGGITPDEAIDELRGRGREINNELELKEYLQDLQESIKQLKETIKANKVQLVTQRETTILEQRIKDIDRGIRAGKIFEKKDIKAKQEEIIQQIMKSGLELRDKGKLLRSLKNIKVSQERIDKLLEEAEKRKLVKKILKQPKHPENIVDVKYQKQIDNILDKLGDKKQTRKKSLNAMSVGELVKLADTLAGLKETGKKVFASKRTQAKIASEIMRAALIKQAGGTKEGVFAKGSVEERKAKRSPLLKVADIVFMRPLRMIRRLLGDVGESLIYNTIDNADMQRSIYSFLRKKKIETAMADNKVTFWGLGKLIEINGKSYQVNNILRMYLAIQDEKSYKALIHGNNLTEEEVTQFIDAVKEEYPGYIKFADEVQKIVAERTNEYAQTVEDYFNVVMERVKVYFPLRRIGKGGISQEELNEGIESEMVYEQILRKGAGFTYTSADKKNTISRKDIDDKFQPEISLDFIGDAIKIIEKQEHLMAYAPLQKAFNKILNDPDLQDAIKYNHGQSSWKWLNDYLMVNINPDLMMQGSNWIERYVNRALKPVRLGLSKAYLGFNVITSGKQFPSLILALKYTTPQDIAISMERMFFKNNRDRIYELDPSLKNRIVSRDFKDLLKTIESLPEGDIKRALLVASKSVDKKAFAMIMQMDKYAVLSVYDAVYRHQLKTKSEAEAKDIAHKAVIETQPQGGMKDLPAIYRTNNEFLRLGLMFTNQLNQIWNMMRADMPREIAKGEYSRAAVGIASIMISSTLIYIMSHGRLPEDPDDFFDAIFGSAVSSIPIIGNWSMAYIRGYEPSISPLSSIMNNLKYIKYNIQSEEYLKAMEKASFILAVWLQLPYSQPRRTIKGMIDLTTGETDSFRRLLWSEFMLENQ